MSQDNIERLRQGNDAFNRGDRAAWLEGLDPEAEMVPARDWPERAPVRGREAIWDYYAGVVQPWEFGAFELGEVIEAGADKLVMHTHRHARGRASGASVMFSYWALLTYRDGKLTRIEWFAHRTEALEAAGLSELAMSRENVSMVRRVNDLFNAKEVEQALDLVGDDFEMDWTNSIGPLKGVYRGRQGVLELWTSFLDAWESVRWDPEQIIEVDETQLVVLNHVRMRGRGSGVQVDASAAQLWTITNGTARRIKLFQSKADALEAARLRE